MNMLHLKSYPLQALAFDGLGIHLNMHMHDSDSYVVLQSTMSIASFGQSFPRHSQSVRHGNLLSPRV